MKTKEIVDAYGHGFVHCGAATRRGESFDEDEAKGSSMNLCQIRDSGSPAMSEVGLTDRGCESDLTTHKLTWR